MHEPTSKACGPEREGKAGPVEACGDSNRRVPTDTGSDPGAGPGSDTGFDPGTGLDSGTGPDTGTDPGTGTGPGRTVGRPLRRTVAGQTVLRPRRHADGRSRRVALGHIARSGCGAACRGTIGGRVLHRRTVHHRSRRIAGVRLRNLRRSNSAADKVPAPVAGIVAVGRVGPVAPVFLAAATIAIPVEQSAQPAQLDEVRRRCRTRNRSKRGAGRRRRRCNTARRPDRRAPGNRRKSGRRPALQRTAGRTAGRLANSAGRATGWRCRRSARRAARRLATAASLAAGGAARSTGRAAGSFTTAASPQHGSAVAERTVDQGLEHAAAAAR
jgi:hypothetical protein